MKVNLSWIETLMKNKITKNWTKALAGIGTAMILAMTPTATHAAAFTAGNIVVYRIGTGSGALGSTATAAFLDEYTTSGTFVQSIALPTTVASSGNRALTASGSASSEGQITLSTDGQYIACVGYNAAVGTAGIAGTANNGGGSDVNRVVGQMDASGNINSTTALIGISGTPIYTANNIRGAVISGSSIYSCGASAPLIGYSTLGGNTAASVLASGSTRVVNVFGGNLYYTTSTALQRFTGLPTTTATPTSLLSGLTTASGFVFLDVGNSGSINTCYLADGASLKKYSVSGTTLTAKGTATITGNSSSISGVTAKVSGSTVTLYISSPGKIETITDSTGSSGTLSGTATALTLTGNPVTLGANAAFRGIAFAPSVSCTTPTTYNVTGGGSYCAGGSGMSVGLDNSQSGVNYQLFRSGTIAVGSFVAGTGVAISFGNQTVAGSYTVVATNTTGNCTATMTGSATITVNPAPTATVSGDASICSVSSAVISAALTGTGPWNVTWSDSVVQSGVATSPATRTVSPSVTTVYTVTDVTDANGCTPGTSSGSATITVTASITPSVTVSVAPGTTICDGTAVTFTAAQVNGGGSPSYMWRTNGVVVAGNTGNTFVSSALVNGETVDCQLTSSDICAAPTTANAAQIVMTVNPLLTPSVTVAAAPGSTVCSNTAVTFTATVVNGGTSPTYQWRTNGVNISGATGSSLTSATILNGSVVTVVATPSSEICVSAATATSDGITMTVNPVPSSTITSAGAVFAGSTGNNASVPTTSGATYAWTITGGTITSAADAATITYTAGSIGTIVLNCTVSSSAGCVSAGSVNVNVVAPSAHLVVLRLGDGSQTLSANGNSVFLDQYDVAGTLVQTVSVPDSGSSAVIISGNATSEGGLMRSPDGKQICFAGYNIAQVSSATSLSGTTASAVPRSVVTVNGGNGVVLAATTSSQFSGNNIRSAATDGANNFWGAGGNSGTYYLGTAAAAATIQNTVANTRVINIINGNLYFSTASGTARGIYAFSGQPTVTASATQIIDATANGSSYGFAINQAGTIAYVADDRTSSSGGIQKYTFNGSIWSLAYTLGTGVANTGARSVTVDWSGANPVIYATTGESTGANRLIAITDTGAGSTSATLATAGTGKLFRGVTFAPIPAVTAQPLAQNVCAGSVATFMSAVSGTPAPAAQWQVSTDSGALWNDIGGATSATYSFTPVLGDSGNLYRVVFSNINGTAPSSAAALTVNSLPDVAVNSAAICAGGSVTLTATTAASSPTYLWSPGGETTASITVSPSATTTYTVTITDGTATCVNSGSGTVTVNPLPTVAVNSATVCAGGSAMLTATTSANSPSYLWSPGGATTASITVSPASTTTYTVTVTAGTTTCVNSGSGTVTVNPLPTVAVNSAMITAGDSATLTATTTASSPSYLWSPGGQTTASITVTPSVTTTYTVTVTDGATTCMNSSSGTVTVNPAVPPSNESDVPLLPPWGVAVLMLLLVGAGAFAAKNQPRDKMNG